MPIGYSFQPGQTDQAQMRVPLTGAPASPATSAVQIRSLQLPTNPAGSPVPGSLLSGAGGSAAMGLLPLLLRLLQQPGTGTIPQPLPTDARQGSGISPVGQFVSNEVALGGGNTPLDRRQPVPTAPQDRAPGGSLEGGLVPRVAINAESDTGRPAPGFDVTAGSPTDNTAQAPAQGMPDWLQGLQTRLSQAGQGGAPSLLDQLPGLASKFGGGAGVLG